MTIIVNCRLHLSVYRSLIARDGQDSHLRFYCLYSTLLTDHVTAIQKGNVNIGQSPQGKLYMQCCRNYSAVFLHLLTFLSVGPQILIHITTNVFSCNPPQLLVLPLSDIVTLCCALAIYTCQLMVHETHLCQRKSRFT